MAVQSLVRSLKPGETRIKLVSNLEVALKEDNLDVSPKPKMCINAAKKS